MHVLVDTVHERSVQVEKNRRISRTVALHQVLTQPLIAVSSSQAGSQMRFSAESACQVQHNKNLAALFLWHLSAFLSGFGQSNCNGLLSACYLAALSPFARAKSSFFLSTHGACNSLTRSLTIFSARLLCDDDLFFVGIRPSCWWHLVLSGYIKLGSIF